MRPVGLRRAIATVGPGLILFGIASYGFLGIAARACAPLRFAPLSLLWLVTTTIGTGLFLPLEQELARFIADRRSRGESARSGLVLSLTAACGALALMTLLGLAFLSPISSFFAGRRDVVLAVLANLVGQALTYVARGVAAGTHRYHLYGAQLAVEGMLRVTFATGLALAGSHSASSFGLALAASSVLSVLVVLPARGDLGDGVDERTAHRELSTNVMWLVLAALMSQGLANSTPVLLRLHDGAPVVATAQLFATLLVARLPLFLFAAVQAALIPGLSAAHGSGDETRFRRSLWQVRGVVASVAGLGICGAALLGVPAVHLLFGPSYSLGRGELVLLAAGTGAYLVASVEAQAALARGKHAHVAGAWTVGFVADVGFSWLPVGVLHAVAFSFLAGSAVAALMLLLPRRTTRPEASTPGRQPARRTRLS